MDVGYVDCCRGSDEVGCQNWASVSMGTWMRSICLQFMSTIKVLWGASLWQLRLEGPLFQTRSGLAQVGRPRPAARRPRPPLAGGRGRGFTRPRQSRRPSLARRRGRGLHEPGPQLMNMRHGRCPWGLGLANAEQGVALGGGARRRRT